MGESKSKGQNARRTRRAFLVSVAVLAVYLALNAFHASVLRIAAEDTDYCRIVFSDRECQKPVFAPTDRQVSAFELVDPQWMGLRAYARGYIPIIRWANVYRLKDDEAERELFFAPAMRYEVERLSAKPADGGFRIVMFWVSCLTLSGALMLLLRWPLVLWRGVAGVLLLRCTSLFWSYWLFGFFTDDSGDEVRYLHTALKLIDWSYVLPDTRYTIGNPLLYLPVVVLSPARWSETGLIGVTTLVYFVVFGLGAIVLWMELVRCVSRSLALSVWSGVALVLYPWLWRVFHIPQMENGLFSFFGLWLAEPLEKTFIDFFYFTNLVGYNALSDTPAMVVAVLALVLLQRSVNRGANCFWAGLVFGFSLMIRITNIFLVLPAAVLLLGGSHRRLLSNGFYFIVGAFLAFSPQLLWNRALFGDPFFFGYKLIEEDYKGFEIANFSVGVHVVGGVFQQLMAFSSLALLLARSHFRTLSTLLAACIVPLLVFYAGYHAIAICPVRFVLTAVCAMIVASVLLFRIEEERGAALVCLLVAVLVVPGQAVSAFVVPAPAWTGTALACAVALLLCRRPRRWPYMAYCLMIAVGSPVLTFGVTCAVGLWVILRGLFDERAVMELRERFAPPRRVQSSSR